MYKITHNTVGADIPSAVVDHAFESNQLRMNEGDIALPSSGRAFINDSLSGLIAQKKRPEITKEFKDAVFERAGIEDSYSSFCGWHYYRFPVSSLNQVTSDVSFAKSLKLSRKDNYSHCEAITLPNGQRHYYAFKTFEGYERWQTSSALADINDEVRQELLYRMGDYYQISPCSLAFHAVLSKVEEGHALLGKLQNLDEKQWQQLDILMYSQVSTKPYCPLRYNGTEPSFSTVMRVLQVYAGFSERESKLFTDALVKNVCQVEKTEGLKLLKSMEAVFFGYIFEKLQDVEMCGYALKSTVDVLHVDYCRKQGKKGNNYKTMKALFIKGKENAEECLKWMRKHGLTCSMKPVEHPDYDK